jgi:hypothetical protein
MGEDKPQFLCESRTSFDEYAMGQNVVRNVNVWVRLLEHGYCSRFELG